jgi:vacuolar-type H+-ATPase subunit F/Vma7
MSDVAVIGEHPVVAGFALAGARVYPAHGPTQVQAVWRALPETVAIVILTPAAADAVRGLPTSRHRAPLTVVMPL